MPEGRGGNYVTEEWDRLPMLGRGRSRDMAGEASCCENPCRTAATPAPVMGNSGVARINTR